ncbi:MULTISPECIES: GtrA family protein [unclassified Modestobacter]|uniref:GtrA family protein n=1 Tax=unclassified Modestobacter TaxID=2643866 RepID=UPI0022AAB459|nr:MULTISPECIES: GtrA family protein [unclassified Modestobacter]MCZ2823754.1 GtrA family protein [Modestobacter sp. VKM Ac-2981]MCZ2851999.1 GtrA family protein [Modestobacter sp. VKM Ac-2982]
MRSPRDLLSGVSATASLLGKELGAFGVVGAICFLIQVGCFQLLYAHLGVGAVTSNAAATVISMTAAYVGHRYWSFSHRARSGVAREYLLFAAINGVTLLLGLAVVAVVRYPLGQDSALVLQVANVCSIVLGTVIRYLAYRRWVFLATVDAGLDRDGLSPVVPEQPQPAGPTEQTERRAPLSS